MSQSRHVQTGDDLDKNWTDGEEVRKGSVRKSPKKGETQSYCWWKKSCTSWYVVSPTIYRFYTSQVVSRISEPSTVWPDMMVAIHIALPGQVYKHRKHEFVTRISFHMEVTLQPRTCQATFMPLPSQKTPNICCRGWWWWWWWWWRCHYHIRCLFPKAGLAGFDHRVLVYLLGCFGTCNSDVSWFSDGDEVGNFRANRRITRDV